MMLRRRAEVSAALQAALAVGQNSLDPMQSRHDRAAELLGSGSPWAAEEGFDYEHEHLRSQQPVQRGPQSAAQPRQPPAAPPAPSRKRPRDASQQPAAVPAAEAAALLDSLQRKFDKFCQRYSCPPGLHMEGKHALLFASADLVDDMGWPPRNVKHLLVVAEPGGQQGGGQQWESEPGGQQGGGQWGAEPGGLQGGGQQWESEAGGQQAGGQWGAEPGGQQGGGQQWESEAGGQQAGGQWGAAPSSQWGAAPGSQQAGGRWGAAPGRQQAGGRWGAEPGGHWGTEPGSQQTGSQWGAEPGRQQGGALWAAYLMRKDGQWSAAWPPQRPSGQQPGGAGDSATTSRRAIMEQARDREFEGLINRARVVAAMQEVEACLVRGGRGGGGGG